LWPCQGGNHRAVAASGTFVNVSGPAVAWRLSQFCQFVIHDDGVAKRGHVLCAVNAKHGGGATGIRVASHHALPGGVAADFCHTDLVGLQHGIQVTCVGNGSPEGKADQARACDGNKMLFECHGVISKLMSELQYPMPN
jgi:hypothetical protein